MVLPSKNVRTACGKCKSLKKFIVIFLTDEFQRREEMLTKEKGESSACLYIALYFGSGISLEPGLLGWCLIRC